MAGVAAPESRGWLWPGIQLWGDFRIESEKQHIEK
jgi:hypothetical protein